MTPGRSCPLHYRYAPADLARTDALHAECLYVIGGLYGNGPALDEISDMARHEVRPPVLVFNGDFNWFNIDHAGFNAINSRVLMHHATRGNVETELASEDETAGCGCGYPDFVNDAEVDRSNEIMRRLRGTACGNPELRRRLGALPMYLRVHVGGTRVAIVHGDCESLAGWGLSRENLASAEQQAKIAAWFETAKADVIASSHSCLPVLQEFSTRRGVGVVANNGAAGMPNFSGTRYGIITRIGVQASPHAPLYGTRLNGVQVDALAVRYDVERWHEEFHANWPANSPAHRSYAQRIARGPLYSIAEACSVTARRPAPVAVN
ncbi:MAG: hypothetical protein JWN94_2787 [Betaproteobacteria bacterium]|nr:hypothetical protein [Betaproteobacteria bacterium]